MGLDSKIIRGKWNKNEYRIEGLLGEGGVSKVYKVYDINNNGIYALKISQDLNSITKEAEMLTRFHKWNCIPKVVEVDDYCERGKTFYYIVMEYIVGENLKEYILKNNLSLREIIGMAIIIGEFIENLHEKGFIFGDLKLENIMIDKLNKKIKLIDFGGVTPIGNSLREFTPLYDRAKWKMGLRRADTKYDLFSMCILLASLILREKKIINMNPREIIDTLKERKINRKLVNIITKGLLQKGTDFNIFLENLKKTYEDVHLNNKIIYNNRVNLIINSFLLCSILCFLTVLLAIFIL